MGTLLAGSSRCELDPLVPPDAGDVLARRSFDTLLAALRLVDNSLPLDERADEVLACLPWRMKFLRLSKTAILEQTCVADRKVKLVQ